MSKEIVREICTCIKDAEKERNILLTMLSIGSNIM
jgi:hypothetical protein